MTDDPHADGPHSSGQGGRDHPSDDAAVDALLRRDARLFADRFDPPAIGAMSARAVSRDRSWWPAAAAVAAALLVGVTVVTLWARQPADRTSRPADDTTSTTSVGLPTTMVVGSATFTLDGLDALHMVVSAGSSSRQLTLSVESPGLGDSCHPGEVPRVTRQDDSTVEVTVGRYVPATGGDARRSEPAPTPGTSGATITARMCDAYETAPHRETLELDAPLGTRQLVDGSTGRPVPVLDASTTPYPAAAQNAPYVLTGVVDGPVVTWTWLAGDSVTLRPEQPVPADEASYPDVTVGEVTARVSGRPGRLTLRWDADATHAWQLTIVDPGGVGFVRNGVVVDYGNLTELIRTFHPAGS